MCGSGPMNQYRWEFSEHCWENMGTHHSKSSFTSPFPLSLFAAKFLKGFSVTTLPTPSSSSLLIQLRLIFTPFPPTMKRLSSGSPVTMRFLCLRFSMCYQTSSYLSRCRHLHWLHAFTSPVWRPLLISSSLADIPSRYQVAAQNEHLLPNPPTSMKHIPVLPGAQEKHLGAVPARLFLSILTSNRKFSQLHLRNIRRS